MKRKIITIISLFFAIFGGTLILKFIYYSVFLKSDFKVAENLYEQAFIALFIAILLTFRNGIRLKWNNEE